LASATGINAETIRFYEKNGLVTAPPRSKAGRRLYPESAIGQLNLVKRLRRLGFSLADIRVLLGAGSDAPSQTELLERLADLDERKSALRKLVQRRQ
jgi:MerR family mercuric resistance operon transcriptional regulator